MQKELNPKLWEDKKLKRDVREAIIDRYTNYIEGQNAIIMFSVPYYQVIVNKLPSSFISAPIALKPFKCKLIGLAPIEHPPGNDIVTFLYLPSKAPIK